MSYFDFDERNQRSSSRHTEWVCLLVFVVFTFVYLYFYQADVLAAGQHVLSGGQTHYRRLVGAVLITLVLLILQRFIFHLTPIVTDFCFVTHAIVEGTVFLVKSSCKT